jgi:hypothetical protein
MLNLVRLVSEYVPRSGTLADAATSVLQLVDVPVVGDVQAMSVLGAAPGGGNPPALGLMIHDK